MYNIFGTFAFVQPTVQLIEMENDMPMQAQIREYARMAIVYPS